jgi:tRNA(Ile)-lysidine synthase
MRPRSESYLRWAHEMRRSGMFRAGERVGVAVSGGPDSVLLLDFLSHFAAEAGLALAAVHFNHHLRGEESDEDERFVRRLAHDRNLPFFAGEARVAEIARERRRNLEATARELRYRYFFSLVSQGKLDKVATAHTANDQAETVLLRLLRGAGTRGLGGIHPTLEGKIVRPFLSLSRSTVETEIAWRKLEARLDTSNLSNHLTRNKMRHELLPLMEREYSPEIVRLLGELAERARDDESYLEEQARARAQAWRVREGATEKIPLQPLAEFHPAIARRVLRQAVQAVRGTLRGVTHQHIEDLRRLAGEAQSGRKVNLPGGLEVRKEFGWLVLSPTGGQEAIREFSYPVRVPGTVRVPELGATFEFKIVQAAPPGKGYNETGDWALDPEKMGAGLALRNWQAGDCYQPAGSHRPEKLKELFRRRKIPASQRLLWPVLAGAQGVVWVRNFPPSQSVATQRHAREHVEIIEKPIHLVGDELSP